MTEIDKVIEEYINKEVADHNFNREWLTAHLKRFTIPLLEEREREAKNKLSRELVSSITAESEHAVYLSVSKDSPFLNPTK